MSDKQDEKKFNVQVDQRALINKVLARYPGEFTCKDHILDASIRKGHYNPIHNTTTLVFREFLQNSDDAESSTAEIHFKTAVPAEKSGMPGNITHWVFKNNGHPFDEEDWNRLTRIALGNPHPRKVGAFGVGFYSLFSVTDGPIVSSGGDEVKFYWDGDQLCFRRKRDASEVWTAFEIPLRELSPMPEVVKLMQFLATSITFMEHLRLVRLFLDEHCIGRIQKTQRSLEDVDLPIELERRDPLDTRVANGRFQRHEFTIQAEILRHIAEQSSTQCDSSATTSKSRLDTPSFPLRTGGPTDFYKKQMDFTMFSVEVEIEMDGQFSSQLSRCMSKVPASPIKYCLVYTGKDAYDLSSSDYEHHSLKSIFQELRADLTGASHSKIFIGHPTSQTTGIGGHMGSQFIPTAERESIDLADRNVAAWNGELLYIGGFLSRAVYELELSDIQTAWARRPPEDLQSRLRRSFIHVMNFFTFYPSTPAADVARHLQEAFFTCSPSPPRLLSSVGVRSASDVRLFDSLCNKFLKHVPMLAPDVTDSGQTFFKALPQEYKVQTVTISDVLDDLRRHHLESEELIAFLQWEIQQDPAVITESLQVACFRIGDDRVIQLSSIHHFIDLNGLGAHIPPDGPFPPSLLPRQVSRLFSSANLAKFGWQEFTVVDWLHHISNPEIRLANPEYDFSRTSGWAERVLRSISSAWSSSKEIPSAITSVLMSLECIPTTCGLRKPEESYLPSSITPTFEDEHFPIIQLSTGREIGAEMERLLKALEVRQYLPPRLLIRMVETGQLKTSELIAHLIPVAHKLNNEDVHDLNSSDAFEGVQIDSTKTRFRIKELYPPVESFRQLHLPLIDLGELSKWEDSSPEAALLYHLGLNRFPPLDVIMNLCSQDDSVGAGAFVYLCNNLQTVCPGSKLDGIAFVPAEKDDGKCLEMAGNVFLDKQWKTLGFAVIRSGYEDRILEELGVQRHPPSSLLLDRLKTSPPADEKTARDWFEILSTHVSRFSEDELNHLSQLPIVPKATPGGQMLLAPIQCYLKKGTKPDLYLMLFHFVNLSDRACQFLRACHAKDEPSEEDVAMCLIDDPDEFYRHARGKRFLDELRYLASWKNRISNATIGKMRLGRVLLGLRCEKPTNTDEDEDAYVLCEPRDIVIVDDEAMYQLFADSIITAPRHMSPELEDFYVLLGCHRLTTVVCDHPMPEDEREDASTSSKFQSLVLERVPLFLHYYPHPKPGTSSFRLSATHNINITVCRKLSVSHTLTIRDKQIPKKRRVSATAIYANGVIQLWLTHDVLDDKFELAVSLCRVLLGTENRRDAEFLKACLSEERDDLKRRGYLIDQVHRCLQCDKDWGISGVANLNSSAEPDTPSLFMIDSTGPFVAAKTNGDVATEYGQLATRQPPLRRGSEAMPGSLAEVESLETRVGSTRNSHQVVPRRYIQSIVKKSIQAPGRQAQLRHDSDKSGIKFMTNDYCEVSKSAEDFYPVGQVGNVVVCVPRGLPEADTVMKRKRKLLDEFVRVIANLSDIYDYPVKSLRIFYDNTAGCIAFNCESEGVIYLNLRYFAVWHYQQVRKGDRQEALLSWYFTLAHEIAHNLVRCHNSKHEFLFSVICEAHMAKFSRPLPLASMA